ncbi:MAG: glycerate kinase [Ruminococcaceae bacterium]|nr:glycerate kinase [Oscillospiraceae bacterium]
MKILLAPDSFKGCLSSSEVCRALERGIRGFDSAIEIIQFPSSDGGEGFCDCMLNLFGGDIIKREVTSPIGERVSARYGYNKETDTAFIELALAAGLHFVDDDSPSILKRNTFGVGELIKDAVALGAKKIIMGLGGSATNDCGIGILSALGVKFFDKDGCDLEPIPINLNKIVSVDKTEMIDLSGISIVAACDVKNPLCGENGAAKVFAKQKGASAEEIEFLDEAALQFSKQLEINPDGVGYGAAGGVGMALVEFLGASYVSGAELLVDSQSFQNALEGADLLITGEGNSDSQTINGKLVSVVVSAAKAKNVDSIVISGGLSKGYEALYSLGAKDCYALCERDEDRKFSIYHAPELLENIIHNNLHKYCK